MELFGPGFLHVNLGNILTILSFLVGGVWFIASVKGVIELTNTKTNMRLNSLEQSTQDQKEEIKKLAQILITLGRYEERFLRVEQMLDDLRRGRGMIKEQ